MPWETWSARSSNLTALTLSQAAAEKTELGRRSPIEERRPK